MECLRSCQLDFARLCLLGTLDLTEALSASSAFESEADAARVVRMLAHDTVRIMYKASPPLGEEPTASRQLQPEQQLQLLVSRGEGRTVVVRVADTAKHHIFTPATPLADK